MSPNLKRPLLISVSVILGSILIAAAAVYFLSGSIASQAARGMKDRALIDTQTGALAALAGLKAQEPQAAAYQNAIEKFLPPQDNLLDFNDWISSTGLLHGVTAIAVFEGRNFPAVAATPGRAGFSLTVTGSVDAITAFIEDIESKSQQFLISLSSFDLTSISGSYRLAAQGVVFFR